MRKSALVIALAVAALLSFHCAASNPLKQAKKGAREAPFATLKNYCVRSDVDCSEAQQLILDSEEDFNKYFHPAPIMGGAPTDINWKQQFVIAILLPKTNRSTMVTPMKVKESPGNIIFYYQVNKGSKTHYSLVPFAAVVLERAANATQTQVFYIEE
jgi:hypothetical protein